jgi:K+-sensing histidine kinase KdpD
MEDSILKNPLTQTVSESRLSDFLINLSHEFRTPLAIILMELDQLLKDTEKDNGYKPELQESISHIKKNSLRISKVINNLIDVMACGQGVISPKVSSFDAVKVITDITATVRQTVFPKHLLLCNNTGERVLFIKADEGMLERAFLNLLSNAIKHSKKDGSIYVIIDSDMDDMTLSVRDEGGGIKKETEKHIFKKLLPGGFDLAKSTEGLGVGLLLVKAIADAHNGRVWLKNEPGHGSTFYFVLPIESRLKESGLKIERPLSFVERVQMELSDIQV